MTIHHTVRQGECLQSIAHAHGFADFRALYDHPDNAPFRKKRPNPNVLRPGDRIAIPDKEAQAVSVSTGATHTFVVRLPRRALHVVFRDEAGEPFANVPYELTGPGVEHRGTTSGDGAIQVKLPLAATDVEVAILGLVKRLHIGHLDPAWDDDHPIVTGIQARLANLGYDPGSIDGVLGPRTARALRAYQRDRGLSPTGRANRELAAKLESDHGC